MEKGYGNGDTPTFAVQQAQTHLGEIRVEGPYDGDGVVAALLARALALALCSVALGKAPRSEADQAEVAVAVQLLRRAPRLLRDRQRKVHLPWYPALNPSRGTTPGRGTAGRVRRVGLGRALACVPTLALVVALVVAFVVVVVVVGKERLSAEHGFADGEDKRMCGEGPGRAGPSQRAACRAALRQRVT